MGETCKNEVAVGKAGRARLRGQVMGEFELN